MTQQLQLVDLPHWQALSSDYSEIQVGPDPAVVASLLLRHLSFSILSQKKQLATRTMLQIKLIVHKLYYTIVHYSWTSIDDNNLLFRQQSSTLLSSSGPGTPTLLSFALPPTFSDPLINDKLSLNP